MTLRYSFGRLIVVVVLVAYAVFAARAAYDAYGFRLDLVWSYSVTAVLSLGAASGLVADRPWSRFIVYLLGISYCAYGIYYIAQYTRTGVFSGATPLQIVVYLGPSALTIAVALLCVWLVRCQFVMPDDQRPSGRSASCPACGNHWPPHETSCRSCGHTAERDCDPRDSPELESPTFSTSARSDTLIAGAVFVVLLLVYFVVGYRGRRDVGGIAHVMVATLMSLTVSGLVIGVSALVPPVRRRLKGGAWLTGWLWIAAFLTMLAIVGAKARH